MRSVGRLARVTSSALRSPPCRRMPPAIMPVGARSNSFIRTVLEQVKKDIRDDETLQKSLKDLQDKRKDGGYDDAAKRFQAKAAAHAQKLQEGVQTAKDSSGSLFGTLKEKFGVGSEKVSEALKDDKFKPAVDATGEAAAKVSAGAKAAFDTTMNASVRFTSLFNEDRSGRWQPPTKAEGEAAAANGTAEADAAAAEDALRAAAAAKAKAEAPQEYGIVVRHDTAWDKFGANMRDMPFLNSVYDNPLFDRLFGETEIASSIREMKLVDPSFSLSQLTEEVEETLAPHLVQCYLEGDDEQLKNLCGEAAFTVLNQSIVERRKQRVTLDPTILRLSDVELRAAKIMENAAPIFVYGFQTQQINCLRNADDEVVDGAVDDIRSVHYLMVVTKAAEEEGDVEAPPWIVNEVAIVAQMQAW